MASTKLRALFSRRKGRDIYDLYQIGALPFDEQALRKLTLYYFYHARMIFSYPSFLANLHEKIKLHAFADDVRGLIRVGQGFDWDRACRMVIDRFAFLDNLDERDREFLDLARLMLGKPVSESGQGLARHIEHPLAWLMEGVTISAEAASLRQDDIRLFTPAEEQR